MGGLGVGGPDVDSPLVFNARGFLPPGDHPMTLAGLRRSILVVGPPGRESWNRNWREWLIDRFGRLVVQLRGVGVHEIYVGGSFASDKDHPGDLDGYFACDRASYKTRALHKELNILGPFRDWTWRDEDRRPARDGRWKLPLWHHCRVELFPHHGQTQTGFFDDRGNDVDLPTMFRMVRGTPEPRGVVRIAAGPPDPRPSPLAAIGEAV